MWILSKIRFQECEFCQKWRFSKCEFFENYYVQNMNFWINQNFCPSVNSGYLQHKKNHQQSNRISKRQKRINKGFQSTCNRFVMINVRLLNSKFYFCQSIKCSHEKKKRCKGFDVISTAWRLFWRLHHSTYASGLVIRRVELLRQSHTSFFERF